VRDETDDWHLAKQIAAGILIAAAVLGVVYYGIQVEKARRVNAAIAEITEKFQRMSAQHSAETAAANAARRAKTRTKAAEDQARQMESARLTQAAADRSRLQQAEAAAKEQAWQQFYKPPEKCANPAGWDTQVECGNMHIRAQREFEVRWQRAELSQVW